MEKVDRRVRRTRRRLRDALIQLILDKGYAPITIQEITDTADLSRATFYLHYKDKDELLASSLEEMFDELVESIQDFLSDENFSPSTDTPPSLPAFQHVAEYRELYKALLGDKGVTSVIYRTIEYTARLAEKRLRALVPDEELDALPVPLPIVAQHVAGSLFALVSWWLEHDMPHSPEEMAQMYHRMTVASMNTALGWPLDKGLEAPPELPES